MNNLWWFDAIIFIKKNKLKKKQNKNNIINFNSISHHAAMYEWNALAFKWRLTWIIQNYHHHHHQSCTIFASLSLSLSIAISVWVWLYVSCCCCFLYIDICVCSVVGAFNVFTYYKHSVYLFVCVCMWTFNPALEMYGGANSSSILIG